MSADWKKTKGLLDELVNNSFEAGANKVESHIESKADKFIVYVKDNGSGMTEDTLQYAEDLLSQPRRDEIENYYGELAGKTVMNSGLSLVGMMSDEYTIDSTLGKGTEITLYIYKSM